MVMEMVTVKSFNTSEQCEVHKVPYSAELKEFLTESRKHQTLYSDSKGPDRKVFQFNERNLIEEFISSTMFFKKCMAETVVPNMEEEQIIKNITEGIIKEGKKYHCEVHLSVIWVYYFVYHEKKTQCLPVFKIYRDGNNRNEATYLDASLKVFQCWDHYTDDPGLEESLLCFPRDGEYHFNGNVLNLEYMLSKNIQLRFQYNSSLNSWQKSVAPFTNISFQLWVEKVRSSKIYDKVRTFWKDNRNTIVNFALEVLVIVIEVSFTNINPFLLALGQGAIKILFMKIISGEFSEGFSWQKLLQLDFEKFLSTCGNKCTEASKLLQLLRSSSKNWPEILYNLSCLMVKCSISDSQATPRVTASQAQNSMEGKTGHL